ncbi:hypothetical protein DL96DRAFT_1588553 [Flagelloscypha sp. PMI_526]|nr:hypothetical protein DL96DRAFT_1588553 [Flagelloscypha sp. PMI_526]
MFSIRSLTLLLSVSFVVAAPIRRQTPCFVTGSVTLPAEVQDSVDALAPVITCGTTDVFTGVPDVTSGGASFSDIDFRNSDKSPVGFALETFATPEDPASADLATLQDQLNTYLAVEAGLRSVGNSADVGKLKGPKFFLQFQIARVNTANGVQLGVADTVEHQLEKVTKNAVGASAAEIAEVNRLATVV